MAMHSVLYYLISFVIEFLKMYLLCFSMFRQQAPKLKIMIPAAAAADLICTLLSCRFSSKSSLFVWVLTTVCCFVLAKTRFTRMISLIAYPVISVLDMTAVLPLMAFGYSIDDLQGNPVMMLFANMFSIPLLLLLTLIVRIAANKRSHMQFRGKLILPVMLFLMAIGAMETAAFMIFTSLSPYIRTVLMISLMAANLLSLALCVWVMRSDSDNLVLTRESRMMQKQMELQKQHYTRMMEKSEELRSFRHDIRNHIYCMRVLLDEGNLEELKKYMDSMDVMVHSVGESVKSGNKLLDAIIGEQIHNYPDVKVTFSGTYPEQSMLSDTDFCTIFFNALSNAFEAAVQTEEKLVSLQVRTLETHMLFTVSNSALSAPQMRRNRYISTKQSSGHGYGMANMIECLQKNQLQYDTDFRDGVFTLNIYYMNALEPFTAKN